MLTIAVDIIVVAVGDMVAEDIVIVDIKEGIIVVRDIIMIVLDVDLAIGDIHSSLCCWPLRVICFLVEKGRGFLQSDCIVMLGWVARQQVMVTVFVIMVKE